MTIDAIDQVEQPDADALHAAGVGHHRAGALAAAIDHYRAAAALRPDRAETHNNLGIALKTLGRADQALDAFRKARMLRPEAPEIGNNLANLLQQTGDLDGAIAMYRGVLRLHPHRRAETLSNLAGALMDAGDVREAVACYEQAMQADPNHATAAGARAYAEHFVPDSTAASIGAAQRAWARRFADTLSAHAAPHANNCDPHRRLRVGFVSPDFADHPVGRFLLPLFAAHDSDAVEVFCYADVVRPDAMTARLRAHADVWRDTAGLDDAALAERIRQDRIDILVDLTMHLTGSRLLTFARRPAPVQVTYLAYCSTTGMAAMYYRLTDVHLDPPDRADDGNCAERSVRLPTYWCYAAPPEAPPVVPPPSARNGFITFGCLNNFAKVSEPALRLWCEILRAVPASRLVLHAHDGSHRARARAFLASQSIDPDRLSFEGFLSRAGYFARYNDIDIALDPVPYAGGTTTCDALWMGVSLVTLAGQTAVGRGGVSILSNLGLHDLIARDHAEYVRNAAALAQDPDRRALLRSSMRQRMRESPLMNAQQFAHHFQAACRRMWTDWCDGRTHAVASRAVIER